MDSTNYTARVGTHLELVAQRPLLTLHGQFQELLYVVDGDREVVVLTHGDISQKARLLVRVHSFCYSGHALLSRECNCLDQMHDAQQLICAEGTGAIIVLDQDGRGFGHRASILAHQLVSTGMTLDEAYVHLEGTKDGRSFEDASRVLISLDIQSVRLMTENPRKAEQLRRKGIHVDIVSPTVAGRHA